MARFTTIMAKVSRIPSYNKMHNRAMSINYTREAFNSLAEATDGISSVNVNAVSQSGMIGIQSKAGSTVSIDNGWDAERSVIVILVKDTSRNDYYALAGYTNKPTHVEGKRNVNPETVYTFNTITKFERKTKTSGEVVYVPSEADLMFGINRYDKRTTTDLGRCLLSRPKDVLSISKYSGDSDGDGTVSTLGSTAHMEGGHLGKGDSLDVQRSATKILQAASSSSIINGGLGIHDEEEDAVRRTLGGANTSATLLENELGDYGLLEALFQTEASSKRNLTVTHERMCKVLGGFRPEVINKSGHNPTVNIAKWDSRSMTTATSLANSIPGYMMHFGILGCSFVVSNIESSGNYKNVFRWMGGADSTSFMNIEGLDTVRATKGFEAAIRSVVFPTLSKGRKMTIAVACRLTSDMSIELDIDGRGKAVVAPTFSLSKWGTNVASEEAHAENSKSLWALGRSINNLNKEVTI